MALTPQMLLDILAKTIEESGFAADGEISELEMNTIGMTFVTAVRQQMLFERGKAKD